MGRIYSYDCWSRSTFFLAHITVVNTAPKSSEVMDKLDAINKKVDDIYQVFSFLKDKYPELRKSGSLD